MSKLSDAVSVTDAAPPKSDLAFEPRAFFFRPWWGTGVTVDALGRVVRRYRVTGVGRGSAEEGGVVEQTVEFDDGPAHGWSWRISPNGDGLKAVDEQRGIHAAGTRKGAGFEWVHHIEAPTPLGRRRVKVHAAYSQLTPKTAMSVTTVLLFGFPISRSITYYNQAEAERAA